ARSVNHSECLLRNFWASEDETSLSSAYWREVASNRKGARSPERSLITQDVATNLRRRVTTSVRSIPSPTQTASTSSNEKEPDIHDSLRNKTSSGSDNRSWLQSTVARRVCCRPRLRPLPPVSKRNR